MYGAQKSQMLILKNEISKILGSDLKMRCILQNDQAWRAAEKFFAKFFGFLFDNTSPCYLVFASFFSTLLAFILLLIFDEYGLK